MPTTFFQVSSPVSIRAPVPLWSLKEAYICLRCTNSAGHKVVGKSRYCKLLGQEAEQHHENKFFSPATVLQVGSQSCLFNIFLSAWVGMKKGLSSPVAQRRRHKLVYNFLELKHLRKSCLKGWG